MKKSSKKKSNGCSVYESVIDRNLSLVMIMTKLIRKKGGAFYAMNNINNETGNNFFFYLFIILWLFLVISDLSVAVVRAWDADDTSEGNNARLTYSIEKNVLQDNTGAPLFQVCSHF